MDGVNYVHVHKTCSSCGGCIYECEHRVTATITMTNTTQPKDQPVDELREKAYALARELVEYEFHSPQARFKSEIELAKDYCEQILELCQADCNRALAAQRQALRDEVMGAIEVWNNTPHADLVAAISTIFEGKEQP